MTTTKDRARLVFLGTGNAFNTDGRGSQCLWIEPAGQAPILVDAGPTALAAMGRFRLDPAAVDRVFITHLHGDHTAGWPFLLLHAAYFARRDRRLSVFGPRGTKARLESLSVACYEDLVAGGKLTFPLEHMEIDVRRSDGLDAGPGLRFDVVPVDHHATSIAYRFHLGGLTIGVSGDTRWCPALEDLSKGCDLLVLECTCVKKPDYAHVSLDEVREGRARLGTQRVVLTHLSDEVARELREKPIAGVEAADDGMILWI